MHERAHLIGAELTILANASGGVTVRVEISDAARQASAGVGNCCKSRAMSDEPIRILLVDDHELIRSGLGGVIDLEHDLQVVGTAGTVAEAIAAYESSSPTWWSPTSSCPTAPASTSCARSAGAATRPG